MSASTLIVRNEWTSCCWMERTKKETGRNNVALITERDVHLMIEDNMRSWTATISHSHAVTNNPQLEPYDSGKPHSYIAYLDAKNLYGTTLSEPLTTRNFRFALRSRNFRLWCDDRSGRRPLAIDCRIQLVVSRTSDYATTRVEPEHLNVSLQMFSDYAREIVDRNW